MTYARFGCLFPAGLLILLFAGGGGCSPDLDTERRVEPRAATIGETIYRELCQRVAYTAELEEGRPQIDVSGQKYRATCVMNAPAPPDAPAKLLALQVQRQTLIAAVDRLLPEPLLDPVDRFLVSLVPLYDDGTMEEVIDRHAGLLARLSSDAELVSALVRLQPRIGYRPGSAAGGILPALVSYPELGALLDRLLTLVGKGGRAETEFRALLDALGHEAAAAKAPVDASAPDRTLRLALQLAFTTTSDNGDGQPRLVTERDRRGVAALRQVVPPPLVDRDGDGLPDLDGAGHFVDDAGQPVPLGPPFAPPGWSDTYARDALGRLLDSTGQPLYRSVDLDPTLLAALLRELPPLLSPSDDTLFGLVYGAGALLGPRRERTKQFIGAQGAPSSLSYRGFATEQAALLDLAHGYLQLLAAPRIRDLLTSARTLLVRRESSTTRALAALLDVNERGKAHPEASIPRTSTLYDDLIPIIARTLRVPGLMADLMTALEDPHVRGLGAMLAYQMRYRDRFALNQNDQTVSGSWQTTVDRGLSDSDYNRSILQRMAHLIHDANNVQFCNKQGARLSLGALPLKTYARCEMFRIDDLSLFYILAMADRSVTASTSARDLRYRTTYSKASFREAIQDPALLLFLGDNTLTDATLQSLTGIDGFTRFPTPEAANRSLFLDQAHQSTFLRDAIDPVLCSDGDRFIDVHNDTIFAWERPIPANPSGFPDDDFYDAIRPLITAFARHDECLGFDGQGNCVQAQNAAKIFVDLMSVLHEHWGSPSSRYFGQSYQSSFPRSPRYSTGDGVVSYERLLDEVLSQSDLVPALIELVAVLNNLTIDGTPSTGPARPVLLAAASFVFDPRVTPAGIAYRDGSTQALKSDGVSPAGRVTPYYLLADAYARRRTALDAAPPDQQGAWRAATSRLVDQLLTVETVAGQRRLKNRRLRGVALALVDFLEGRIRAHEQAGDLAPWIHQRLTADLTEAVSGPVVAAAIDFTTRLEETPETRDALYGLLAYLAQPTQTGRFTTLVITAGDLLQALLDDTNLVPVVRAAGSALLADRGVVDAQFDLLAGARALDPGCPAQGGRECTVVPLLRNLFGEDARGVTTASDLADVIGEVHRRRPGQGGEFDAADYRSVLDQVRSFLVDERRGFLRFVKVVKGRAG